MLPRLQITRSDYFDLGRLTASRRAPALSHVVAFLERELSRAEIVDDALVRPDVATLGSHLAFHDEATRRDWAVTLGHPSDVVSREDAISVMSPLGAALIGLSEGQSIAFRTADGRDRRIALVRVIAQPRAGRGWSRSVGGLAMTSDKEIGDEQE